MPMHSFAANISAGQFVVSKFNADDRAAARKKKDWSLNLPKGDLDFNNEPLENVFDKLNERFHANIKYTSRQLKGLHFTGTIFQTDSLKTIVTIISRMNDLTFEEQDGYILIHQKK
jgi:ferric-dicitrate binding protein FerR (iron transport regulator)